MTCASGDGAARIGCPAYQCKSSHLSRGALAHLVAPNTDGTATFSRLETFRAEKAQFIRRVQEDDDEDDQDDDEEKDQTRVVTRFCPDARCNKLLRGVAVGASPLMLLCECGGVVCAACGAEDGHFGLSCDEKRHHSQQVTLDLSSLLLFLFHFGIKSSLFLTVG